MDFLAGPAVGSYDLYLYGATFFFAVANVYYRDVGHILQILLQIWFYFSPILYSLDMFPARYRSLFKLNPMIYILNGFRLSIYLGKLPYMQSVAASFLRFRRIRHRWIFQKHQDDFVFYV